MTSSLSSAPASWEDRRGESRDRKEERKEERGGIERGEKKTQINPMMVPAARWLCPSITGSSRMWMFGTSSSENGAVIPLMHALKTGQLQEVNSAEFYYLHMSKEA